MSGWSLLLMAAALAAPLKSGDYERQMFVDGRLRTWHMHIPPQYDGSRPMPVVLAFHGAGGNAQKMAAYTGLNQKADQAGFIVVYPNGTGMLNRIRTFNAGNCCGYAMRNEVDDVAFARQLLDEVERELKVDSRRIYATGISNGAMMCYRLAAELSGRIAAIAPVAGPMELDKVAPSRPVPVIHFHGTKDDYAPYAGGVGSKSGLTTPFSSVEDSIQTWVRANGLPETPTVAQERDASDDGTSVWRTTYGPGRDGVEVVLLKIEGGGHTWPGSTSAAAGFLGPVTRDISANDLIWEFFEKHPLPETKR